MTRKRAEWGKSNPAATLYVPLDTLIDDHPEYSWPLVFAEAGLSQIQMRWRRWLAPNTNKTPRISPIVHGSVLWVLGYDQFEWPLGMIELEGMDTPAALTFDMQGVVDYAEQKGVSLRELARRGGVSLNQVRTFLDPRKNKLALAGWNAHTLGSVMAVLGLRPSPPFVLIVHYRKEETND